MDLGAYGVLRRVARSRANDATRSVGVLIRPTHEEVAASRRRVVQVDLEVAPSSSRTRGPQVKRRADAARWNAERLPVHQIKVTRRILVPAVIVLLLFVGRIPAVGVAGLAEVVLSHTRVCIDRLVVLARLATPERLDVVPATAKRVAEPILVVEAGLVLEPWTRDVDHAVRIFAHGSRAVVERIGRERVLHVVLRTLSRHDVDVWRNNGPVDARQVLLRPHERRGLIRAGTIEDGKGAAVDEGVVGELKQLPPCRRAGLVRDVEDVLRSARRAVTHRSNRHARLRECSDTWQVQRSRCHAHHVARLNEETRVPFVDVVFATRIRLCLRGIRDGEWARRLDAHQERVALVFVASWADRAVELVAGAGLDETADHAPWPTDSSNHNARRRRPIGCNKQPVRRLVPTVDLEHVVLLVRLRCSKWSISIRRSHEVRTDRR